MKYGKKGKKDLFLSLHVGRQDEDPKIEVLLSANFREKNLMDNSRELERLLRKAKKVGKALKPPTISVVTWEQDDEEPPEPGVNEWQLRIMIEQSSEPQ